MSGGLLAGTVNGPVSTRERAPAISGDVHTLITGDVQEARRPPLPPSAGVADPSGLLGLPRRPASWFVGRQEAWQELATTLESGTGTGVISQAVVGLGGVGKSELALQYAFARRLDYDLVWWIDADSPAQIQAGLARALVAGTDSVAAAQASPEEAAAWALAWLAGRAGWLLIFDNVEEPPHLEPHLARLTSGHVLITTRRDVGWQRLGVTPLRLDTLPRQASIRLLGDLIGPPHAAHAAALDELAAELGDLPLALTQAGAYIAATPRCTPAGYLPLLRQVPSACSPPPQPEGTPNAWWPRHGRSAAPALPSRTRWPKLCCGCWPATPPTTCPPPSWPARPTTSRRSTRPWRCWLPTASSPSPPTPPTRPLRPRTPTPTITSMWTIRRA
ncbi:hypothetical protein ACIBEJ_51730 [Nonomuraea sp. NPDC050790]|uniref:hypothetical protein n=1 Tax=Nonomuraea sp. NPDC050790 TaxID=3364371 RepID=UPI0037BCCC87